MGGITLNVWVAALFYDPVEKHLKRVPDDRGVEPVDEGSLLLKVTPDTPLPFNDSFTEHDLIKEKFNRSASSATMQNYFKFHASTKERKISVPVGRGELVKARSGTVSPNHAATATELTASQSRLQR